MRNSLGVPVADPKRSYLAHKQAIDRAIAKVLDEGHYILGNEVAAFEASFAAFVGVRFAIGVASGTDALALALQAHGIQRGDGICPATTPGVSWGGGGETLGPVPLFTQLQPGFLPSQPKIFGPRLGGPGVGGNGD